MAERSGNKRTERSQRCRLGNRNAGRNAKRPHGPDKRRRRTRILILHQCRESERRRIAAESQSSDVLPLEVAATAGTNRRLSDRAPVTRSGSLLPQPSAPQPTRRNSLATEPRPALTRLARISSEGAGRRVPSRDSAPVILERVCASTGTDRVLEEPRRQTARSPALPARRSWMEDRAPVSVAGTS